MRIESVDLGRMHQIALQATNALLDAARLAGHGLKEYFEDQLVHEIGYQFRPSRRLPSQGKHRTFTYIKCHYPDPNSKKKTDVLVEGDAIDGRKHCIWIEIKYKKYRTSSDSGLGSFKSEWQEDLEKLRRPRQGQWGAVHHSYWTWLYIFSNYTTETRHRFGEHSGWKRRMGLKSMAEFFAPYDNRRKLGQTLWDIHKAYKGAALCSIMPPYC